MRPADAARLYIERGWCPIRLRPWDAVDSKGARRGKAPERARWQEYVPDLETVEAEFPDGCNVGLRLGNASSGLVDVDFDHPLAARAGAKILPPTGLSFGRGGRITHAFYSCHDIPSEGASEALKHPVQKTERGAKRTIIELRADGVHQTMVPPSRHPDGEFLEWRRCNDPAEVSHTNLRTAVRRTAAAVLIATLIGDGDRHEPMLRFAGALLRGCSEEVAVTVLQGAYSASGGTDWADAENAIASTKARIAKGDRATGWKRVAEEYGADVVERLREWLGVADRDAAPGRIRLLGGADVQPQNVEWLWPGRLVVAELNEIVGDAGLGKSNILADITARVTTGREWPDGAANTLGPRRVLWVSAEDHYARTIVPRVIAAGGDRALLDTIAAVEYDGGKSASFHLGMVAELEAVLAERRPAIVMVDPLNSFIGSDVRMAEANAVRPRLEALRAMVERAGVTLLWIRHKPKKLSGVGVHMGSGIADVTAVARSSLVALEDQEEPGVCYLAPAKSNLGARASTLRYHVEGLDELPGHPTVKNVSRVLWDGVEERTLAQLMAPPKRGRASEEAKAGAILWLQQHLSAHGPTAVARLIEQARGQFTERQLRIACKEAGFTVEGRGKAQMWKLPPY